MQLGLKKLQIGLALDHFGATQNSLEVLKHCKADYINVDGGIIAGLTNNKGAKEKIDEITKQAASGTTKVIANGVNDPHTLASTYSIGVDYIQGDFLQEPATEMNFDFSSM